MDQNKDIIVNTLGHLGSYQLYVFFLVLLSKFSTGWVQVSHVFFVAPMEYFCKEPANVTDPCSEECNVKEFNRTIFKETIVTEWDLTCHKKPLQSLEQTMIMFGVMLGNIVVGMLSDRYGRKPAFIIACLLETLFGILVSVSPSYIIFVILRFLTAFFLGGTMVTSIVIIMELIGSKYRELMSITYQIPFNLGHASLPLFAYFFRHWRDFNMCFSGFTVIFIIYIWTIPESPRWLITHGEVEKAVAMIEKGAKFSKLPTDHIRSQVESAVAREESRSAIKKAKIIDLFKTPNLCIKTLAMAFCWFVVCMVYYGVAQYMSNLSGDIFINVAIGAFSGVPGTLICVPMTKYLGRNTTLIASNSISAIGLLGIAVIPVRIPTLDLIFAILGLFGASITFPNVYLYGAELFPTVVRNSGVGFCSFIGRIGSMIAPFISQQAQHYFWLPPLVYGTLSAAAVASCFVMPETKGFPLPESLEDGENFGKKVNQ